MCDIARLFLILRRKFLTQQTEAREASIYVSNAFAEKKKKYEDGSVISLNFLICRGSKM